VRNREGQIRRLELLLQERCAMVDALNGKLEQARAQNQRLDAENESLAELVRLG
jgi:hypothetical protein